LTALYESYSQLQMALAADDLGDAKTVFVSIRNSTKNVPMQDLSNNAHVRWMGYAKELDSASQEGQQATSLDKARQAFRSASNLTLSILRDFGHLGESPLYQFHCPMAFSNEGADWLQASDSLRNPYFGSSMLHCGTLEAKIPPTASTHDGQKAAADQGGE
jgi:Cu(I)/Ag(I) efflux system membrane fusion protein